MNFFLRWETKQCIAALESRYLDIKEPIQIFARLNKNASLLSEQE